MSAICRITPADIYISLRGFSGIDFIFGIAFAIVPLLRLSADFISSRLLSFTFFHF